MGLALGFDNNLLIDIYMFGYFLFFMERLLWVRVGVKMGVWEMCWEILWGWGRGLVYLFSGIIWRIKWF